ncbi:GNAT family N-acetyltransferase [Prauserella halophila]|uniref:GNAT family N-acetyltransferase n=1 Tax=Prauserella halophila TaxID=185641 RepID=A0ABN1WDM3_9PSEU|nr:GNAT family N-acetyltransferase [Prauserella halophila]MCP2238263.1 Acetyltransferase (GNAT) domain-containing protein [Prauserella halophila]
MPDPASAGETPADVTTRHATPADLDVIGPAYGEAAYDEAVASWLLPDEDRRRRLPELPAFHRYVRELVEAELLVVTEFQQQLAGFSVWLEADGSAGDDTSDAADASADESDALLREVYGDYVDRVRRVGALTAQRHPDEPYFYLQQMAVLPAYRGRGLGGSMLRHGLAVADGKGLPTYLEASTPRNRALYQRHGFADVGSPVALPEEGPRLQPMRRAPSASP